jgi:hypothetical protein
VLATSGVTSKSAEAACIVHRDEAAGRDPLQIQAWLLVNSEEGNVRRRIDVYRGLSAIRRHDESTIVILHTSSPRT